MKSKSGNITMWKAILPGLAVSLLFTVLGAAIGAAILNAGGVRENATDWIKAIIWGLSLFLGQMLTLKLYDEKIILSAAVTAGGYLAILFLLSLAISAPPITGAGRAILAVLAGSVAAVLLNRNPKMPKRHKARYRTR